MTAFLVDQQLPKVLANCLIEHGHDARHIKDYPGTSRPLDHHHTTMNIYSHVTTTMQKRAPSTASPHILATTSPVASG